MGGWRGYGHRGHLVLFSACFQELLTTYPSTVSTSQPTSHSTKRRRTELLSNVPRGRLEFFFHLISNLCQKVGIYNATIFLVKTWKPQCKINDANFTGVSTSVIHESKSPASQDNDPQSSFKPRVRGKRGRLADILEGHSDLFD